MIMVLSIYYKNKDHNVGHYGTDDFKAFRNLRGTEVPKDAENPTC